MCTDYAPTEVAKILDISALLQKRLNLSLHKYHSLIRQERLGSKYLNLGCYATDGAVKWRIQLERVIRV